MRTLALIRLHYNGDIVELLITGNLRINIQLGREKALNRGKLTIEEITEDNSVSIDFVLEVQRQIAGV